MATIVFEDPDDEFTGRIRGTTFSISQAGHYVKRRPSPINSQRTARMKNRLIFRERYEFWVNLDSGQKSNWATFAALSGITGPFGRGGPEAGFAAFTSCAINNRASGHGYPTAPGPPVPIVGVNFTALVRIDLNTVRATFNPSPTGGTKHIYLRQALPGPGVRRWDPANGYIAEYSAHNVNSPFDFTVKFDFLAGYNCRFWCGTMNEFGGRSVETQFDIAS